LYCNFATAVVAAASKATTKTPATTVAAAAAAIAGDNNSSSSSNNSNSNCQATAAATTAITNVTEMREVYEPEVTIRRMYKCGSNSEANAHATLANNNNSNKLHCNASNCSGCQMSAAAASFQLANLINTSMLLPTTAAAAVVTTKRNHNNNCNSNSNNRVSTAATTTVAATVAAAPKKPSVQFHCEFCNFSCSWRYDLKLHLRQKHGIHQLKKA